MLFGLVVLAGIAGYWIAGGFSKPSYEWIHPSAQSGRWWETLTALGVPAAIAIALFGDWRTHRRFEKQLTQQAKLDLRADQRQQAEWNKRTQEKDAELEQFRMLVVSALVGELTEITRIVMVMEAGAKMIVDKGYKVEPAAFSNQVSFARPIFDRIGSDIAKLHSDTVNAISKSESFFQDLSKQFLTILKTDGAKIQDMLTIADKFVHHCCQYIADLENSSCDGDLSAGMVFIRIADKHNNTGAMKGGEGNLPDFQPQGEPR